MEERFQHDSRAKGAMGSGARAKGLVLGLIAGLVATIVIDLIMVGVLLFLRQPAEAGFAVIGDTAAGFFSLFGIDVASGVLPGVVWHYLIGLALGVIFVAAVTRFDALRLNSMKKGVGLGIPYTEVMSIPMLVLVPIILKRTASDTARLFVFFFVMHAIWGILLGVVVTYRLRPAIAARQG
ncbi:MAG: hypothetical protein MUO78_03395 [candidate division Zixibacteria bacterium]|nr:hypothetical protein [candidate division Zixibacteria bacterium]